MKDARTVFMKKAIAQAKRAAKEGEVPVGAVIVKDGMVIARGRNRRETSKNALSHAEIEAIGRACKKLSGWRLFGCDLYVTLEPCPMCAAAIAHARLRRLYFGAYDPKGGGVEHGARVFERSTCHHRPEVVGGLYELEAAEILRDFFRQRR